MEADDDDTSDFNRLQCYILSKSRNQTSWHAARQEWQLQNIYEEPSNCICGHRIVQNCVLENRFTRFEAIVGNCCVKQFEREDMEVEDGVYASLRRLTDDPEHTTANAALLNHAFTLGILSQSDADFYTTITTGKGARKHFDPSHPQRSAAKIEIRYKKNRLILMGFMKNRPKCHCNVPARPCCTREGKFFFGCVNFNTSAWCRFYSAHNE